MEKREGGLGEHLILCCVSRVWGQFETPVEYGNISKNNSRRVRDFGGSKASFLSDVTSRDHSVRLSVRQTVRE